MSIAEIRGTLTSLAEARPVPEVMEAARELLGDQGLDCDSVIAELGGLPARIWQSLVCRSVDTTTHLKLSLDLNPHRALRMWLHVYKPWPAGERRFAASIHDHRYAFVSRLLRGAYGEQRWALKPAALERDDARHYVAGEVNTVRADEIHSLTHVEDGTVTLVAQMPVERTYSRVYDPASPSHPTRVDDLEARLASFLS